MPTNRGDALLQALRTVLLTVSTLPTVRLWQNQRGDPSPTTEHVEDEVVVWDTAPREVGPSAWGRSRIVYRIKLRVPKGTDAHVLLAKMVAIADAFRAATMSISSQPVEVLDIRTGPILPEPQWLYAPINVTLTFDHA